MYLDPGFGSMLLQIIVAFAAIGGATIFMLRKKVRALFKKDKAKNNRSDQSVSGENKTAKENYQADDMIDALSDGD